MRKNSDNLMKISKNMAKLVKRSLFIDYRSGLHLGKFAEIIPELAIKYSTILKDSPGIRTLGRSYQQSGSHH